MAVQSHASDSRRTRNAMRSHGFLGSPDEDTPTRLLRRRMRGLPVQACTTADATSAKPAHQLHAGLSSDLH